MFRHPAFFWAPHGLLDLRNCLYFTGDAQFKLLITVHAKNTNRCPADCCSSNDVNSLPRKVIIPSLHAGMKKKRYLISQRISPCEIGAFVQVAVNTR